MKLLITGGAGYIGSHTNHYLATQGVETVVLDDLSDGHRESVLNGRFVEGSFGDRKLLDRLMTEETFDGVIHLRHSPPCQTPLRGLLDTITTM